MTEQLSTFGCRPLLLLSALFVCGVTGGCSNSAGPAAPTVSPSANQPLPPDAALRAMVDEAIDWTREHRELDAGVNYAWQVMHGVLAYGQEFRLLHDGRYVKAMDWLLEGGKLTGWELAPADHGVRALIEAEGGARGQGHEDQWLAIIAQCDYPSSQPLKVGDRQFTLGDLIQQSMWDVYDGKECSWTLIGLSTYLPMDASWPAADGTVWNLERIIAMEAAQDLDRSACGGSHRLIGMTMALARYRRAYPDKPLARGWKMAHDRIDEAVATARRFQLPSGAFSVDYFAQQTDSPDLGNHLGATGHTLEFLALALDDDQLQEPWITQAVVYLSNMLRDTRPIDLECGKLYHAIHGLQLYRQKRFGTQEAARADVARR